ncbi:MAG: lytic transglycosylase domain-containing protein [Hyphomicrobiales bacterium]|nr:lytic transglycosylase domain-containing protein [Hyphomicrobiales bacterium]MCP4998094.1 lytic transglycosylase domain-containing protein [Hyphomicrobiales bacterium]
MIRTGTFIGAIICAGLVSLTNAANAEEENTTKIGVDLSAITSSIFKPADPSVQKHPKYSRLINTYAKRHGIPSTLAHAVVSVESNFNPKARGRAGEIGLMQIKLATARLMGYRGSKKGLYDPETNIKYGMKYLGKAHELSGGKTCGTILRYNAGHAAKRMNKVSSRYCTKVKKIIS